jgi:hypothetical protein
LIAYLLLLMYSARAAEQLVAITDESGEIIRYTTRYQQQPPTTTLLCLTNKSSSRSHLFHRFLSPNPAHLSLHFSLISPTAREPLQDHNESHALDTAARRLVPVLQLGRQQESEPDWMQKEIEMG